METIIVTHSESEYNEILRQAVAVVESSRANVARAIVGASNEMHWRIGQLLYERKLDSKRGDGVVKRLSVDLKARYPKMGMSVSNLWAMKKYYGRFRLSELKLQRSVGVLPWRHINQLMTKLKDDDKAIQYYADKTIEKGWNCDLLVNAIKMEMHKQCHEKNVSNNFVTTLPTLQAAYANEVFKDSYCMGFLGVTEPLLELELERRLVEKIK
ncbi:MAG: DUF1016 domain-containing protein, partial [Muribaculaceae bacterium]|nr:DUF1016 domain-containing protein [Muribaculaceae bacterium]